MISIFNGRKRSLGDTHAEVFAQLSVEFRQHLYLFKGARLHVFLCVALHADDKGWAYPTIEACIRRETGYNRETIILALNELCQLTIEGHRVLLAYQPINPDGTFQPNQYLIFPTPKEVAKYETNNSRRRQPRDAKLPSPSAENPNSAEPSLEKPNSVKPNSENPHSKKNQPKPEPSEAEPTNPDDDDALWARQIIHEVLSSRGIDDPVPEELAKKLGNRIDGVELMMYGVQRAENNAASRLEKEHGPTPAGDVTAAAQRQIAIMENANGLLIYRMRKKAPDPQSKILRTIQAARGIGIDAWLISAGADPITVSLWREGQDALLREAGLDLIDPPAQTQQTQPSTPKTGGSQTPATPTAQSLNSPIPRPRAEAPGTGIEGLPTAQPTGKHLAAWDDTRNALERKQGRGGGAKWLKSSQLVAAQGTHFVIGVPNQYVQEWFEQRLMPGLKADFAQHLNVANDDVVVAFVINT